MKHLFLLFVCASYFAQIAFGQSACFSTNYDDLYAKGLINGFAIEKGDFDNDGRLDLIESSYAIGITTVIFSKGLPNGGFQTPVSFSVVERIKDLKAADFNNDGKLDFAAVAWGNNKLAINLGNGNGTFQAPVFYTPTGFSPNALDVADFNEDGVKDIVITSSAGAEVFLGVLASPGTFGAPTTYVTTGTSTSMGVVVADMNGDNHMDFATAEKTNNKISVRYGTGTGTFGARTDYAAMLDPYAITFSDFNNDGKKDLACTNVKSNAFTVLMNSASGFVAPTNITTNSDSTSYGIQCGDFNNDGKQDVALLSLLNSAIEVYLGNGLGGFTFTSTTRVGRQRNATDLSKPYDLVLFDCDTDGKLDAFTTVFSENLISVHRGLGTGFFKTASAFYGVGNNPNDLHYADFNGDGKKDIVVVNSNDDNFEIMIGGGNGTFTSGGTFSTGAGSKPIGVKAADMNADGKMDVITLNETTKTVSVFLGNGTGGFTLLNSYSSGVTTPRDFDIGNLDTDTDLDVLVVSNGKYRVLFNGGTGVLTPQAEVTVGATQDVGGVVLYLANTDALLDFALTTTTGTLAIQVYKNNGAGTFTLNGSKTLSAIPRDLDYGDYNNDGKNDIIVSMASANALGLFQCTGNGAGITFANIVSLSQPGFTLPMDVEFEDFNNDGFLDVLGVFEETTPYQGDAALFMGNGSSFTFYSFFEQDVAPKNMIVADFNNDGRIDMASVNTISNTVTVLMNTTAKITPNGAVSACTSNPATLTAVTSDYYYWSSGETTQSIAPTVSGTYYVTAGEGSWCSSTSASAVLTITSGPALTLTSDLTICSGNSATLTVSGSDGTYAWSDGLGSGTTVTVSPTSTKTYYVTATNLNGCVGTDSVKVTVTAAPVATFNTLASSYCINAANVVLTPTQTGGTFTGSGVSGTTFSPSSLPVGPTSVTYTIDLGGGCSATTTQNTTIVALPNAAFTGLNASYCTNTAASTLVPSVGGGTFSGSGVTGTSFNPATSGTGSITVTYTLTVSGCTASSNQTTTVNALPNATFTGLSASYCANSSAVTLTPTTGGGTFSSAQGGISGFSFNPANATVGSNTVNYTVTVSGCTASSNQTTTVNGLPNATFTGLNANYCVTSGSSTLTPGLTGGTFSGSGVTGTTFNPSTSGTGSISVTYTITSGGCTNSTTQVTNVGTAPNASFTGLAATYCASAAPVTLSPSTGGGTFSSVQGGVSGTTFNPASAALGSNTIVYTVTVSGCTNSSSQTTTVNSAPNASFTGLSTNYCVNSPTVTLTPSQSGGTFTGSTGISGSTFNPATASIGNNTITYTITQSGCTASSSASTNVHVLPNASFSGLNASYCSSDAISNLVPTTSGGTFTGTGISGTTFNPATATVGNNLPIVYNVTDAFGCSNSSTQLITVKQAPDPSFTLNANYCVNSPTVAMNPVKPGGNFTGSTGISGTNFVPSLATLGANSVTYTVSQAGCTSTLTMSTTVHALPNANFNTLNASYCANNVNIPLTPTTSGGVFSGSGVTGSNLNPSTASLGNITVTYSITDAFGCSNNTSQTTTINAIPDASFSGLATTYCSANSAVNMTPVVNGGTFSGTGVVGSQFVPSSANIGTNTVTYALTVSGCSNSSIATVTVNQTPNATFNTLAPYYCKNDPILTLTPVQTGGTFTGNGVLGNSFDPTNLPVGGTSISYNITVNGCSNSSTQSTLIKAVPNANFLGLNTTYCMSDGADALTPIVSGGTFSGTGVSGNSFNPSPSNVGVNTVTYTITVSGCTNTSSQTTTVNDSPDASFTTLNSFYCSSDAPITLVPVTPGGVFSGDGVTGDVFNPALAGSGVISVTYDVTLSNSCSNTLTQNATILTAPNATFSGLNSNYCVSDAASTLTPTITGGTFSGSGMNGDVFNPSTASVGDNAITYTLTGGNGCSNSSTLNTSVYNLPINTVTKVGNTLSSDAVGINLTYQWYDCATNQPIAGATSQTFTPTVNGDYQVVVSNPSCSATSACQNVIVNLGLDDKEAMLINYYPNPTRSNFYIETTEFLNYQLFDGSGRLVKVGEFTPGKNTLNLANEFVPGLYRIHVKGSETMKVISVILEK